MRWTITQVAGAVGARTGAGLDPMARVAGVSIDSRTVRAGELFIAIHGPRHDGHDHVAGALERGALAAMVSEAQLGRYTDVVHGRCLVVADTFVALKGLARAVREAWGRKIAGVTGSVGKTTTKEILAALLGARFRVLKSEGNFNNEYGLPLTLFHLDETHQAAVLEMGMSRSGRAFAACGDCAAGCWRGHARGSGALGIFRVRGRNCPGEARADRGTQWMRIGCGAER